MFNNTFPINIENLLETLYSSQFNLETSEIEKLGEAAVITILIGLIGSLTIGSYFKTALYWYMYDHLKGIKDRPIDILLLLQAIIQHMMCLLMVFTYTIGLSFDITFSHYLGEAWCNVPWYGGTFGAAYRNVGSLGIAIMRLLFMYRGDWMKEKFGTKRMLCVIAAASLIISALMTIGFGIGNGPSSRKQPTWNFCVGKSEKLREIFHQYSVIRGNVTVQHELIPKLILLISLVWVVAELGCYLVIFGHLYLHNRAMMKKKITEPGVVERRQQKNAITFLGQFWSFIVECIVYLLMMYTMNKKSHFIYRVVVIIGFWVEFGLVSAVEVMTSKNLRRYLPHNRIFRQLK
jgi:hypothetical protein